MDPVGGSSSAGMNIKKQEDMDGMGPKSDQKAEQKPVVRTLNRVPQHPAGNSLTFTRRGQRKRSNNLSLAIDVSAIRPPFPRGAEFGVTGSFYAFYRIESMGPPRSTTNVSSMRYNAADNGRQGRPQEGTSGTKRGLPPASAANSADSSDAEEDTGELPASGLVAPWEVLRGLADVAIERAAKVGRRAGACPLMTRS
ncbi:hypothetical protein TRAPUB_6745 [Trametes pubescens]|uniref:Uncharacterized protein n=1 Tax=Trametes pubescens TaxID=154538 RepID=A0A1M2V591_TRAPU|nr:hypothetical protein TRAPUB_6745 [Trametes pubescens]